MRWENFLLQFHFHFAHIPGKQNPVADALSRRPWVNTVSVAYNHDLTSMVDNDFALIFQDLMNGNTKQPYSLNEGFLLHGS